MKYMILATVLTLWMLTPAQAVDVHDPAGTLLAASKQDDKDKQPPILIIKGEGGKVTGVEKGGKGDKKKDNKK